MFKIHKVYFYFLILYEYILFSYITDLCLHSSKSYHCRWHGKHSGLTLYIMQYMRLLSHISCGDWENMCTLPYYHHQIGNINTQPWFRARSWDTNMGRMSCYVLATYSMFTGFTIFFVSYRLYKDFVTQNGRRYVLKHLALQSWYCVHHLFDTWCWEPHTMFVLRGKCPGHLFAKRTDNLTAWFRNGSKSWYSGLDFSNRSNILQTHQQQICRDACLISEEYDHYDIQYRGFETPRDLTVRRPSAK